MREAIMKFSKVSPGFGRRGWKTALVLGVASLAVSGCVVYPSNGYNGYYRSAYPAPAYYAPPVVVGYGWGWGGGWGHRWR